MSRTTSPSRMSADVPGERFIITGPTQSNSNEENANLRKQLRQVETDFRMTRAVLEQKIELLESQINEFQERESNLKKMNETIMLALNDINKDQNPLVNKTAKELELATERHNKEMNEYRARTSELIKNLENENRNLKEKSSEHELRLKELTLHFEKAQMSQYQVLSNVELEKVELENRIKRLEEEKQQIRESCDNELLQKISELKATNERLREEHKKELQRGKESYEKSVQELKLGHENEKKNMEVRMGKMQELLLQEGSRREASTAEIHNKYQKEIQSLKDLVNQMKTEHAIEVNELSRIKEEASDKSEKLDTQVKKLKLMVKSSQKSQEQNTKLLKEKLDKAKSVMEHGENLVEENKKYKQKIVELKSQVKKLEASEQKLKEVIHEKELQISEDKFEFKKMLNFDQSVLSYSGNEPHLSQSMTQDRAARQTSASKFLEEPQSYTNRRSVNSNILLNSQSAAITEGRNTTDYPQFSPLREKSPNIESKPPISSQRYNRSTSSPVAVTPPKQQKFPGEEPVKEKPVILSRRTDPVGQNSENTVPSMHIDENLNTKEDSYEYHTPHQSAVAAHRKAPPLETSFADHGFVIESEVDIVKAEPSSRLDKRLDMENQDKRFSKQIDVDTIPINYSEFLKKTQRSNAQSIDPEKILQGDNEMKTESTVEAGPQIFFTTSQDENQPLFGTSHFVFEGVHEGHDDDEVMKMARGLSNKKKTESGKKPRYEEKYEKKESSTLEDDFDIVEISDIGEGNDDELSVSLHRRESSGKSFVRPEESEIRPSMMNPMHTVYDSSVIDGFNEPQSSVGYLSVHARSVMDRDREREREREKVFSTRCSINGSAYRSESGVSGAKNDSRLKIEGRLKDLEWKLKDMELKNRGLKVEKDKVQFEFEKLLGELKEKKAESESLKNVEQRDERNEREGALKNEIKFLINKLLKVKNKLEKQSEELNITKNINSLGQSQVNSSISGYYLPGKKDYSREYGTLGGGYQNNVSQSRERENWNPATSMSVLNSQGLGRNDYSGDILNMSQLNTSASRLEKYKVENTSSRPSKGLPLENFNMNLRSKSNARYDYGRDSNNASVQNSAVKGQDAIPTTVRTHRSRPGLPRPDDITASIGNLLGRDALRSNINAHNYESYNTNVNVSGSGYDGGRFGYQRKSTR